MEPYQGGIRVSLYRCPLHLEQEVNWKGTGCPNCARDAEKRNKKKEVEKAKKKARREGVEYVEEDDE
jgi:hypothetical protein